MPSTEVVTAVARGSGVRRTLFIAVRLLVTLFLVGVQVFLIVAILTWASNRATWVAGLTGLFTAAVMLHVVNSRMQMEYKLAWTIPIILLPALGAAFYLLYGSPNTSGRSLRRYREVQGRVRAAELEVQRRAAEPGSRVEAQLVTGADSPPMTADQPFGQQPSTQLPARVAAQIRYLESAGPFLPFVDTDTTYYPTGDDAWPQMLAAMAQAQRYILVEYFIVSEGRMWQQMLDVLCRKADEGVEVLFLYDDVGSLWGLPSRFVQTLSRNGIQVRPFNPMSGRLTLRVNNRDHRKLLIVDGLVGFTGGLNIADEYINAKPRFGHWKDTVVRLEGEGVWGMTELFFTLWDLISDQPTDLAALRPAYGHSEAPGTVISFDDTPLDDDSVGWGVYRNMMARARHTVDIMTPYLVPSQAMLESIGAVAQSGVRVRLLTPGIPDKHYVYSVTRSNYRPLIEAGVEIYEYTPGFLHAKQLVADDDQAVLGTINFDFRSFYLHQECAVWMYRTSCIPAMKADFEATVAQSHRVTQADLDAVPPWRRLARSVLRTFAPLL